MGSNAIKNNGARFPVAGQLIPINKPLSMAKPESFNFCMVTKVIEIKEIFFFAVLLRLKKARVLFDQQQNLFHQ